MLGGAGGVGAFGEKNDFFGTRYNVDEQVRTSLHSNLGNKKAAFSLSPWVSDRFLAFSWTLVHFLTLKIVAFLALWGTLTSLLS